MSGSLTPREESNAIIAHLENIDRSYGDLTVIDGLSLEIPVNATTAIVGPNGSGKTTLVQILAGVLPPDAGERSVVVDAERPVGYLPQTPQFRPSFTVQETLQFYSDFLSNDIAAEDIMTRVGLAAVADRRVDALSGGMRRLLGLAQSLLGKPPLVVLDEPTSGLDPRVHQHILDVVTDIAADGTGVCLTTHDLSWAAQTDNVVILDQGEIIVQGPPPEIISNTNTDSLWDAFLAILGDDPLVQAGRTESQ